MPQRKKTQTQVEELEAYCHTCPSPEEVTAMLQAMGCTLDFQMEAVIPPAYSVVAPLPAQYHYAGPGGMSLIFLAGQDSDPDGEQLPPHASRFWAYPGADPDAFQRIILAFEIRWSLTWRHAHVPLAHEDVA